jgi:hypothetical protein
MHKQKEMIEKGRTKPFGRAGSLTLSWSAQLLASVCLAGAPGPNHLTQSEKTLSWSTSSIFGTPVEIAQLAGDPTHPGDFALRVRIAGPIKVQPYSFPEFENITVLSGSLHVGFGRQFTTSGADDLAHGGFISTTPGVVHFWWTDEPTILQFHGNGCLRPIFIALHVPVAPCK